MNTALAERAAPIMEFHGQLEKRTVEFSKALKRSGIDPAYFERVTKTAVAHNPKLLAADRRSLFNALARCAEDGLLPNGKEAVLKIYNSKEGPIVGYERMVEGTRKLVQQSGEITRFEQTIVHENDQFDYELGDHPRILHRPAIGDRGKPILLYSVAQFNDGTLSREVMSAEEIETIRQRYSTAKDGPAWKNSWGEMARKTIAKRHAKVLPMSSDARDALARDDAEHSELPAVASQVRSRHRRTARALADKLDHWEQRLGQAQNLTSSRLGQSAGGPVRTTNPPTRRSRSHRRDSTRCSARRSHR